MEKGPVTSTEPILPFQYMLGLGDPLLVLSEWGEEL